MTSLSRWVFLAVLAAVGCKKEQAVPADPCLAIAQATCEWADRCLPHRTDAVLTGLYGSDRATCEQIQGGFCAGAYLCSPDAGATPGAPAVTPSPSEISACLAALHTRACSASGPAPDCPSICRPIPH